MDKYSVFLEEVNGKKYYRKSRRKYFLKGVESILIDDIPNDTPTKMQFYYYDELGWHFDQETYDVHLADVKTEQEEQEEIAETHVTMDDVVAAMAELGSNQSIDREAIADLELAVAELGAMIAEMKGGVS